MSHNYCHISLSKNESLMLIHNNDIFSIADSIQFSIEAMVVCCARKIPIEDDALSSVRILIEEYRKKIGRDVTSHMRFRARFIM